MRANLGDSHDAELPNKVRRALYAIGATFEDRQWAIGVDAYHFRIGSHALTIYSDAWTADIEGSPEAVHEFMRAYGQNTAADSN